MKISPTTTNFKGYDAVPLKALHFERTTFEPIEDEIQSIAKQENFKVRLSTDYFKWIQDYKTIINQRSQPIVIANNSVSENFFDEMKYGYRIYGKRRDPMVTGGNSFIGRYPDGEKWMMLGESELLNKPKSYIAKEYGIKEKNIIPIPEQNYHLDMFMRPIGYPYVLVDNPSLVEEKYMRLFCNDGTCDDVATKRDFQEFEKQRSRFFIHNAKVIRALKSNGFIPIEIAGVYGSGINFMNAIVNQHPDGTISYITNSTECGSKFASSLEKEFERDLRAKVPNLDKVYFVKGDKKYKDKTSNYMSENLSYKSGGIHCMSMEEPNFNTWA